MFGKRKGGKKKRVIIKSVGYGALGNPHNSKIEKTIEKMLDRGYELKQREETQSGLTRKGYTQLTFNLVEAEENE